MSFVLLLNILLLFLNLQVHIIISSFRTKKAISLRAHSKTKQPQNTIIFFFVLKTHTHKNT